MADVVADDGGPQLPLELILIDVALNRLGYRTNSDPALGELLVEMADDREFQQGRISTHQMLVRSLTLAGDDGPASRLMTFDLAYPLAVPEDSRSDVLQALPQLTSQLVIGHFELDDDLSLHMRYSMLIDSVSPLSDEILLQIFSLLDYQQLHYGDYLEEMCAGRLTADVLPDVIAAAETDD
jgi:hypothetical protein